MGLQAGLLTFRLHPSRANQSLDSHGAKPMSGIAPIVTVADVEDGPIMVTGTTDSYHVGTE